MEKALPKWTEFVVTKSKTELVFHYIFTISFIAFFVANTLRYTNLPNIIFGIVCTLVYIGITIYLIPKRKIITGERTRPLKVALYLAGTLFFVYTIAQSFYNI